MEDKKVLIVGDSSYIDPILLHNPYKDIAPGFSMAEKKKTKPCASHEYTKATAKSEWRCRHCGRILDQT